MLTSGSTGYFKAVCLRHGQMIKAVKGKAKYHGNTGTTVFFNWINIDHVANLTEIHLHAMMLGADQVHVQAADLQVQPSKFVSLLGKHQVGYTFAPNFFLAALRKSLKARTGENLGGGFGPLEAQGADIGRRGKCRRYLRCSHQALGLLWRTGERH